MTQMDHKKTSPALSEGFCDTGLFVEPLIVLSTQARYSCNEIEFNKGSNKQTCKRHTRNNTAKWYKSAKRIVNEVQNIENASYWDV